MARPCVSDTVESWAISRGQEDALHVARPDSGEVALEFGLVRPASLRSQAKHMISEHLKISDATSQENYSPTSA
jgi:hypothetical protein